MFKGGIANLMKQARQLQDRMQKIQEEMAAKRVEASAGGGMVTVAANGQGEILSVKIERQVVDPDDVEMLEDLVRAACNEASKKGREMMAEEMKKVTGGIAIPGMM
ncbi:MAG: YbaB/EbfC family nucleoid-associated protein [Candidatus Tectomicrobia bacterium]|nr:YbaB/EbfC family nucleoid-associated protein [Candidatus Tectomicrobia bacterium]MBI2177877.1 YbaB/EbfC family nucleoid-associated protein [Candidatus Tectomicrobia bacterium]MBI3024289.1 YbaB/EbfC family nucleoid-associated protein [Candidatus Tectomicrobia bacterium]